MDVRCEKCQTEYELDEARLKPGGVTVKCTNCGHMFKIRKRTITNVGTPPIGGTESWGATTRPAGRGSTPGSPAGSIGRDASDEARTRPSSARLTPAGRTGPTPRDSLFDEEARTGPGDDAPTTVERQWLLRLENGEQRSCREIGTLQQWIIAGVVTRESLISRNGKTWKRLGDVADLGQYFSIADEARETRERTKQSSRPAPLASIRDLPGTIPGYGTAPQAAGGTILPDDDEDTGEGPTARAARPRPPANTPPPVPVRAVRTPPMGSNAAAPPEPEPAPPAPRRPITTPPPPPPKRPAGAIPTPPPPVPQGNRATATWATDGVAPEASGLPASGPFVGKLAAIPDEPAFAGRVRMTPGGDATFDTAKVRALDDDDDVLPARRGSRAGMLVLVMALLVMGVGAAVVYMVVIRKAKDEPAVAQVKDAGSVATVTPDAAPIVTPPTVSDAAAQATSPLEQVRSDLAADLEPRLRAAAQALDARPDAGSQALRGHLLAQLAQDLQDRASVTADKAAADALRKEAKQLALDAATAAQRALKEAGDDAGANLAMAEVLRLQAKPARDIKRYLDAAAARADKDWARELALAGGLVLARDGKLDDARAAFAAIDQGDGKLETSGDVRARFHQALALAAQGKAAEARPLVDTILAAQPEHAGAKALAAKLETQVSASDPLPPEDGTSAKDAGVPRTNPVGPGPGHEPARDPGPAAGGDSYDRLLARANALAETSCGKAMDLYSKALEQKPNGVEALTGLGYCHIEKKDFQSAYSKFRAALAVSPKYEPALRGVAENYQQQGRKEQAIDAYKAYLDVYPNSAAAKKQLERLGVDTGAASQPGGSAAPPPPAPTPPPPAPAPTTPEPSGTGSGSG